MRVTQGAQAALQRIAKKFRILPEALSSEHECKRGISNKGAIIQAQPRLVRALRNRYEVGTSAQCSSLDPDANPQREIPNRNKRLTLEL